MAEFQTGVEDSRTLEEMLTKINSSLDLYEVLLTTEYVLIKYDDSSDNVIQSDEDENEFETASVDVTLNLNNDYYRVIRVDGINRHKYSIIAQVDFDNIVHVKEYQEKKQEIDSLVEKIKSIGTGKLKEKAESKYLLNGGKF